MTNKIKAGIEKFKSENGNSNFTQKEILMYIVSRLDNLPCDQHLETMGRLQTDIKMLYQKFRNWRWIATILFSTIVAIIGWCKL